MHVLTPGIPHLPDDWRGRRTAIFAFLALFVASTAHLVEWFPGRTMATRKKKTSRWIVKQRKKKRIRLRGVVQRRETGRPELCYGRRCREVELEHEVRITDFALLFRDCVFERGVKIGRAEPDAVMVKDGHTCAVEIDNTGHVDRKQMKAKWKLYDESKFSGYILVVAVTDSRMERLRKGAELVKDMALFSTFDRLRSDWAEPWLDWYGKSVRI